MVKDKLIKFTGEDRTLKVLSKDDDKTNVNSANFNQERKGLGKIDDINLLNVTNLEDYSNYVTYLNYIIEAISLDLGVSENQIQILNNFIEKCVERDEMMVEEEKNDNGVKTNDGPVSEMPLHIPGELETIYELYMGLAEYNTKFANTKTIELIERKKKVDALKLETGEKKKENDNQLENNNVKKLVLNDKLTAKEKAGFISVAIILEASLIIGGIVAILALVKK